MSLVLFAGCSTEGNPPKPAAGDNPKVTLKIGEQPARDATELLLRHEVAQGTGRGPEPQHHADLFPNSQLGPDAERFSSVQAGDIDMDLQGGSAMSTAFPKIGVLDAAYAFNDIDHFFKWIDAQWCRLLR